MNISPHNSNILKIPFWQRESYDEMTNEIKETEKYIDPLYIILMPGSLHLINLCLRYIPKSENIFLILNGISEWEQDWAKSNLEVKGTITSFVTLDHPVVLNALFDVLNKPFGIIDYDCFFSRRFNFQLFKKVSSNSLGNAIFFQYINKLKFYLPHTHALFFNTTAVKSIMRKYNVDCRRIEYDALSCKKKRSLLKIGINKECLPEEDYNFDTLKLIILFGLLEGKEFSRVLDIDKAAAFHVGCISNPERYSNRWSKRASYFWQKALMLNNDKDLVLYYQSQYPNLPSLEMLKVSLMNDGFTKNDFFTNVEKVLSDSDI